MAKEGYDKRHFLLAGAVLVVFILSFIAFSYIGGDISGFVSKKSNRCKDYDGGLNYFKGSYAYGITKENNKSLRWSDYCKNDKILTEFFCKNNAVERDLYSCPPSSECKDGACSCKGPHYGLKKGKCLPSCGWLAGLKTDNWKAATCRYWCRSGEFNLGSTYDCNKCCYPKSFK